MVVHVSVASCGVSPVHPFVERSLYPFQQIDSCRPRMSCTERQMGAAIVILEVLIWAEMQFRDDADAMYMLLAHQIDVVCIASFVNDYVNTMFLTEMVDIVNVSLCDTLLIGQEEAWHIVVSRHARTRHVEHSVPSSAQSMRHVVCHTLCATATRIDLGDEIEEDIHLSNL